MSIKETKNNQPIDNIFPSMDIKEEFSEPNNENNKGSTVISSVYCSKYENYNGEPHEECYQSSNIEQTDKDGHDIYEKNELYKNSNGVQKAAKQCTLDKKGTKTIKERNVKNGKHNEKKLYKNIEEKDVDGFNKEYNQYKEKVGFKKNYKVLNEMNSCIDKGDNLLSNEKENKKALKKNH